MKKSQKEKLSDQIVKAFLKNKIIAPLPKKFTKKLSNAENFRRLCESKVNEPVIGFKAGGTGIPVMKKLKEKEPFYASIYRRNFIKSGKKVKINRSTLGIELEVCYQIKKSFFLYKGSVTLNNISKYRSESITCSVAVSPTIPLICPPKASEIALK